MKFLNNIKITHSIILCLILPSAPVVYFAYNEIVEEIRISRDVNNLSSLTDISVKTSNLIHAIQKERGASAGFLGSKGREFKQELMMMRRNTDLRSTELAEYLAEVELDRFGPDFNFMLSEASSDLKTLSLTRSKIDLLELPLEDSITYFSELNRKKLHIVSYLSDISVNANLAVMLFAYSSFLQAKEYAGLERAVVSGGVTAGEFPASRLKEYYRLVDAQENYLSIFRSYADDALVEKYDEVSASDVAQEVLRLRKLIENGEINDIEGEYWFDVITKKINGYKEVEDLLSARLIQKMNDLESASNTNRSKTIWIASFFIGTAILLSAIFLRGINGSFRRVVESTKSLAEGNLDCILPPRTNNEIGDIVKALEIFRENAIKRRSLEQTLQKHKADLEEEVQRQTSDLKELNLELEEFAYRTSHDLRSPIVSAIGLLEITQKAFDSGDTDKAMKSLGLASKGLKKLTVLTEDILNLARSKKLQEEDSIVDIISLSEEVLTKLSQLDGYEEIAFQKHFLAEAVVSTKRSRLTMIIENFVSNAIKYRDKSKESSLIKVSTFIKESHLVFEVEDNGLRVPNDQQENLFRMFQRFHPKVSFGSGLGLYLVKKSADAIGATVTYKDTNTGSVFGVKVPLKEEVR